MAADITQCKITSNLIDGASLIMRYNPLGVPEHIEYDRVVLVERINLAVDQSDPLAMAADAVAVGLLAVQARYPVAQPDANFPLTLARSYAIGQSISDSAIAYRVGFLYDAIPWDATVWHSEISAQAESVEVDQQFNNSSGSVTGGGALIPIKVDNYYRHLSKPEDARPPFSTDPDTGLTTMDKPEPFEFGPVTADRAVVTLRYTKQIYDATLAATFGKNAINYVGKLNSVVFHGTTTGPAPQNLSCPAKCVKCVAIDVSYDPLESRYLASLTLTWRDRSWQPISKYVDPITGNVPANVWLKDPGGAFEANGAVETTAFDIADLNALLSSLGGSPASPFGGGA